MWGEATTLIAHQLELCIFPGAFSLTREITAMILRWFIPRGLSYQFIKRQQKVMSKKGIKISSVWSVLEVLKYSKRLEKK